MGVNLDSSPGVPRAAPFPTPGCVKCNIRKLKEAGQLPGQGGDLRRGRAGR